MTKEEARKLYEGKYFYEVVKPFSGMVQLWGPFENIYYVSKDYSVGLSVEGTNHPQIKYIQVINGKPVQAFEEHEILVTDREL